MPDAEIGMAVGRNAHAILARIYRLKAKNEGPHIQGRKRPSSWTPERVAEAQRLISEGLSILQVARRLSTSPGYLSKMLSTVAKGGSIERVPDEGIRISRAMPNLRRVAIEVE